jgi:hypothetical protein
MTILHDRLLVITPIVAIVGFVGCSFSYLHPLMRWKDMKDGIL